MKRNFKKRKHNSAESTHVSNKRTSACRRSLRDRTDYGRLEDRNLLATFIVTTAADNGSGATDGEISLREAVRAANSNAAFGDAPAGDPTGDVIRFDPATLTDSTIFLTQGQIVINDDVLIQGGDSNITISGLDITRLFDVATTQRVGFSRMTFDSGKATNGGAMNLASNGTTLLFETTFTGNVATDVGGGAIYVANGTLFVTDSTFTGNQAEREGGKGGAIYQESGNIFVNGGLMDGNIARGSGGAIAATAGTFFSINSTVGTLNVGNRALPVSSIIASDGGGLHVSGSARVTIQGGEYVGNLAARNGGGMWVGSIGQLFVRPGTDINNNQAGGSEVGDGGGGIFNSGARLYVNQANISLNVARGSLVSGGGIYAELASSKTVLNVTTVDSNAARQTGGGIHVDDGLLQLTNSEITNNDVGNTFASTLGHGGGIYAAGSSTVVVNDGQVANNSAFSQGGGIWAGDRTLVFLRNFASVSFNTLLGAGSVGGGVYTTGYLQALDSFFQRNVASEAGGGLYLTGTINARINNTNFFENNGGDRGGGIFNDSSMYITNVTFAANLVDTDGGAYFTTPTSTTLAQGLRFVNNMPNDTNDTDDN